MFNNNNNGETSYKKEVGFSSCSNNPHNFSLHLNTSFVGSSTGSIILRLNVTGDANIQFGNGNGTTAFDSNGILTIQSGDLDQDGFDVTAQYTVVNGVVDQSSIICVEIDATSNTGYICNSPTLKVDVVGATCKGDFDGNGLISASDLSAFLTLFGTTVTNCYESIADFDDNIQIAAYDLSAMLAVFGTTCN